MQQVQAIEARRPALICATSWKSGACPRGGPPRPRPAAACDRPRRPSSLARPSPRPPPPRRRRHRHRRPTEQARV
jgi:hypothetical protein